MNQPLIDAYLDELLGPSPAEPVQAAASNAPLSDDEVVHAAVADAVTDATHDALAVALLDGYGDDACVDDIDGEPAAVETVEAVEASCIANVGTEVCVHDAAVDPAAAAAFGACGDAGDVATGTTDATDFDATTADAPASQAPGFDADALAAALLEEFDREAAAATRPSPAPAPAPTPVDDDLMAALLAEFDEEVVTRPAIANPSIAKPSIAKPAPEPATEPTPPPVEPAARADTPKRFELPESFAPVPPTRTVDTPPAMRPKSDGRPGQARTGRWLRVCVDTDRYAVELLSVQEVVRVAPIVSMRGADTAVLGVMNLRGRILPVFDLGLWLGTSAVCPDERSRIVVVERNDELIGLLVTAVQDVVTLAESHIEPPLGAGLRGAIVGVARANDAPTVLLDANWLFD